MYDIVTTPRGPNPIITYRGVPPIPQGSWVEHRSRRKREAEVYQDIAQTHPDRGVRQAGHAINLYGSTAMAVDQELRKVPYLARLRNPASGNFPLIVGKETGTGPGPWWDNTPYDAVEDRQKVRQHWREHYVWDGDKRTWTKPVNNPANYVDGPGKKI